jgi:transcription elongation GreA/GreB family factor
VSPKGPPQRPEKTQSDGPPSIAIEVGDLVVVRYNDAPERPLRVRLSTNENRPTEGIVHVEEPLGAAILGASVEDEVEVRVGSRSRTALIERIEKARSTALA